MSEQRVFTNARLFTGVDGEVLDDGSVWVDGAAIRFAGPTSDLRGVNEDVTRIDLGGRFLMPGMTESHAHISYTGNGPTELDKTPVEEAMVHSIDNARLMLGSGFTSAISFGSVHRIDVFLKKAINDGVIPGPRLVASGRAQLAISMYPTSVEELLAVSNAGFLMPPKSTWFEPKLRSGLLVHLFE